MENYKISFDALMIEITRRCNLRCAHCLKGEAQNVDMSFETMDAILNQTKSIDCLYITGGEPTVYLEGIDYLLDGIMGRGIPVRYLEMTTNGKVLDDNFCSKILEFDEYMKAVNATSQRAYTRIIISGDQYHVSSTGEHYDDEAYWYYHKQFETADTPHLTRIKLLEGMMGLVPKRKGRALTLPEDETIDEPIRVYDKRQIEYVTKDKPQCYCMYDNGDKVLGDNEIFVYCPLYVDVFGKMRGIDTIEKTHIELDAIPALYVFGESLNIRDCIDTYNASRLSCVYLSMNEPQLLDLYNEIVFQKQVISNPDLLEKGERITRNYKDMLEPPKWETEWKEMRTLKTYERWLNDKVNEKAVAEMR